MEKQGRSYRLVGFEQLTPAQADELARLCDEKLRGYIEARGERIWQHRKQSAGYISGTLRYEVLKRAKFHCDLCGVAADVRALEVDHITPRSKGGGDDISNLQALCYSCNAMKRDRDDTDFREVKASYERREPGCAFCEMPGGRIVAENELAYSVEDAYPVTELHRLVIPKRHAASYFELGRAEVNACNLLLEGAREEIRAKDPVVKGFNVGINDGEAAGQTILHAHVHLIPRRAGDVANPRGGVRHVILGKGEY